MGTNASQMYPTRTNELSILYLGTNDQVSCWWEQISQKSPVREQTNRTRYPGRQNLEIICDLTTIFQIYVIDNTYIHKQHLGIGTAEV